MIFAQALLNEHGEMALEGRAPPVQNAQVPYLYYTLHMYC